MTKPLTFILTLLSALTFCINAWATPVTPVHTDSLGTNITIFDGQKDPSKSWYTGQGVGKEDQETEPATAISEVWDLEAMYAKSTTLSLVGEWNFTDGHPGASGIYDRDGDGRYTSGDLFIDVAGLNSGSTYGYDFVFDVDWKDGTFTLFSLDASSTYLKTTYKVDSNPWKVDKAGEEIATGTFVMEALSDGLVSDEGLIGSMTHYLVSFDLAPILTHLNLPSIDYIAHFTMECGNDNLMGSTAPVPEPATIILMGAGLIGIAGFTRKRLNLDRI